MRGVSLVASTRRSTKLCAVLLLAYLAIVAHFWVGRLVVGDHDDDGDSGGSSSDDGGAHHRISSTTKTRTRPAKQPAGHSLLPSCHPHWNMAITHSVDDKNGDGNDAPSLLQRSAALPIKRIFFYHVRKAGGTMIRDYLHKVAATYGLHLEMAEYQHASAREEVGSRNDTFYLTHVRDPVERSISHYKFDGRWDCWQLVKNESFVPTEDNARPFEGWSKTRGFEESPCDLPFSFVSCAVNCYVQTFSGRGCTADGWRSEYNAAWDRLLRYNMILVYEKFKDPRYVAAVERFFGVGGFNEPGSMFCGKESAEANEEVPLKVELEEVVRLTELNQMDDRLYQDLAKSCWDEDGDEEEYSFPEVDPSRFVRQTNRTVID